MAFEGMDTDAVAAVARALSAKATVLETLTSASNNAVNQAANGWHGADAASFHAQWRNQHHLALLQAVVMVREMATQLNHEVRQQVQASGGSTAGWAGRNGSQTFTSIQSFAERISGPGHKREDKQLMLLAWAAEDKSGMQALPNGYHTASDSDLRKLGIGSSELTSFSGLNARIYVDAQDTQYVLAFAGTSFDSDLVADGKDIFADGVQAGAVGTPLGSFNARQYAEAVELGEKLHSQVGDAMVVVGHSMGGGQAAAVALATGSPAVTFNAAGLSSGSLGEFTRHPDASVRNYVLEGDPLSAAQDATEMPNGYGTRINIPYIPIPPPAADVGPFDPLKIPNYIKDYFQPHPFDPHNMSAIERSWDIAFPTDD